MRYSGDLPRSRVVPEMRGGRLIPVIDTSENRVIIVTDLRLFDLNLLIAFDAMIAERSVTRAAQRVGIGQPAMSYALSRLRELFDDQLFVRTSGRMQPTSRAVALAEPVARILGEIRGSVLANRAFSPETAELIIELAATDYAEVAIMPGLLHTIRCAAPRMRVAVSCVDQHRVGAMLEEGVADIAIGHFAEKIAAKPLRCEVLFREEFVCLFDSCACDAKPPLKAQIYAELPQITMSPRAVSQHADGTLEFVILTTPHFLTMPLLLHGQRAVAVVPRRLAEGWAGMTDLEISPLPIPMPGFDVSMQWHLRTESDPAQRWVRDLIRQTSPATRIEFRARSP